VSGCNGHYEFVLSAGAPACPAYRQAGGRQESKNCDKQLTHIVRVSLSVLLDYPDAQYINRRKLWYNFLFNFILYSLLIE